MKTTIAMTPDPREREIFLGALDRPEGKERAAYLDAMCAGDASLRERVDALFIEAHEAGDFLQRPAVAQTPVPPAQPGPEGTVILADVREKPGDRIGRYRLLQQVGEGGCGVVFMAHQEEPVRRRVALKVIKLGMDTRSVIARFEAERQALAMMDHPNIARVLDAGATESGRPYFVMELVRGVRLTQYCDENKLATEDRLRLFIQICQAVQHAHQKGIIHRDLKPSNILVTLHDGIPVPKVIDFGIAKATEQRLTDKTLFTEFTAFIGTPAYMSPEQAEMSGLDIDTRSDIYSLGVLLYELLTGRTPFDAESLMRSGLDECRRTIREQEPVRPSARVGGFAHAEVTTTATQRRTEGPRLIHQLRGDLDWIVMKCLEKDRTRRYETANALAGDLQRYLDNEPVLARPPSQIYRLKKMLRRHRLVVGAGAAVSLALIVGAGVSIWQAVRAIRAEKTESQLRQQAEREKAAASLNEYIADMNLAQQSLAAGNLGRAVQLVDKHAKPTTPDIRGFEWRYLWQQCRGSDHVALPVQEGVVMSVALSPDGRSLAVGLREQLKVMDVMTRREIATRPRGAVSLAFMPDGTLISGSRSVVRVWNPRDWTESMALEEDSGPVSLSPNGALLATQTRGGVRVRGTHDWEEVLFLSEARGPMAFTPDGKKLVTDGRNGLTLWSLETGVPERVLENSTNVVTRGGPFFSSERSFAIAPDGRWIAAARNSPSERGVFLVSVWDATTGQETAVMPGDPEHTEHTGTIAALAFLPDESKPTIATASWDHSVRLWDLTARKCVRILHGHLNEVWCLALSADGQTLVTGAKDGGVHLWPVRATATEQLLPPGWLPLSFSHDSRRLAALNPTGMVVAVFNTVTREAERQIQLEPPRSGRMFPPGGEGAGQRPERGFGPGGSGPGGPGGPGSPGAGGPGGIGGPGGGPGGLGGPFRTLFGGGRDRMRFGRTPTVALRADLGVMAQAYEDGNIKLWDMETGDSSLLKLGEGRLDLVGMSPDGRVLITTARDQLLHWWEPQERAQEMLTLEGQHVLFSSNSRAMAVFQRTNVVAIYDVAKRALSTNIVLEAAVGPACAFDSDGLRLVTTSSIDDFENAIHLWDVATGELQGSFIGHKQPVWSVSFAPDGRTLASSSADGTVKFWNVKTQQELLNQRTPGKTVFGLLFSPDGKVLVGITGFGGSESALRVFRAASVEEIEQSARQETRRQRKM